MTRHEAKVAANYQKLLPLRCYRVSHVVHRRLTPEEIDESRYSLELPRQIGHEYYDFMKLLLEQICPEEQKKLGEIMNKKALVLSYTAEDKLQLDEAYKEAKAVTLWEKITKSNHEDVTYYKGLLKSYTEELLVWMETDFVEDI